MSGFSAAVKSVTRKPVALVTLQPKDFHDGSPTKPSSQVVVGLSLLSDLDGSKCRADAVRAADRFHGEELRGDDDWIATRNDALIREALACALCDPNSSEKTYLDLQDADSIGRTFTSEAIRHLWDELERATVANSPVRSEADEDEISDLAKLLAAGLVEHLGGPQRVRTKKLCSFLLDELIPLVDVEGQSVDMDLDVAVG